jgi:hypothetical protein
VQQIVQCGALSAIDRVPLALHVGGPLEGGLDGGGQVLRGDWLVLEVLAATDGLGDLASHRTLGHVVHEVGVSPEDEVGVQDGGVAEVLEGRHLGVVSQLDRGVLVFTPVQFMLKGAHCNQFLSTVLLGETGGGLDEVVLVGCVSEVIMSEVDDILSALEADLEARDGLHLLLLELHARGEGALEGVDGLAVGPEVQQADLLVVLSRQLREHSARDCVGTVHDH